MQNFTVVLYNERGNEIERFETSISPIGVKSVTTKKGCYDIAEAGINYNNNQITLHVSDYIEF